MRVISGSLKGRKILGYNVESTRPTMARVKESMFASIQNDIKDWGKILWESKDDIEPLRKKKKSRKSVFGGKRDFKAIFKKFLKID